MGVVVGVGVLCEFREEEGAVPGRGRQVGDEEAGVFGGVALAVDGIGGEDDEGGATVFYGEVGVVDAAEEDFVAAIVIEIGDVEGEDPAGVPVLVDELAVGGKDGDLVGPVPGMMAGDDDAAAIGTGVAEERDVLDGVGS